MIGRRRITAGGAAGAAGEAGDGLGIGDSARWNILRLDPARPIELESDGTLRVCRRRHVRLAQAGIEWEAVMTEYDVDRLREFLVAFAQFLDAIGDDQVQAGMRGLARQLEEDRSPESVRSVQEQLRGWLAGGMGSLNDAPPGRADSPHFSYTGSQRELYAEHFRFVEALHAEARRVF